MPSKNSINKPKLTAPKTHRPSKKVTKLLGSSGLTAGKITTKVISKKRAKKDIRNAKYRTEYLRSLENDIVMKDDEELSSTQKKKLARLARLQQLQLVLEQDLPAEQMNYISGEDGTTLGGPPPLL
jgi:hypothetical protein